MCKYASCHVQVEKYALQLQLIIKGNPIVAKNFDEQPVSAKVIKKKLAALDMDSKNLTQQKWTSLQQSEALLVLSKFLAKNPKRCQNCKKRNPTITSPIFGWFNKVNNLYYSIPLLLINMLSWKWLALNFSTKQGSVGDCFLF